MRQTVSVPGLKNLFTRKKDIAALLQQALAASGAAPFWVEDAAGTLLFGVPASATAVEHAVEVEGNVLGWVKGGPLAAFVAGLLTQLAAQESEKKKLGAEVLHLYREINLIYNFSEKLTSAVSADAVAQIALEEAGHLIHFSCGVVLLQDEKNGRLEILAQSGDLLFSIDELLQDNRLFPDRRLSGRSDIVCFPEVADESRPYGLLYTPLRVRNRVFGAVLLFNRTPADYTAADLKLLTTLTLQAAAAMESAFQYETAAAKAFKLQQEQFEDLFIQNLKQKLESNLSDENFALPELCQAIGMSRSQLFRKMKALVDDAPSRFIRSYRLQRAKNLLETTDLQVSEVAYRVGYKDPAYFSNSFQEEFGVTPGSVRRAES